MALKNSEKNTGFFATGKISNEYMSPYTADAVGSLKYLLSSTFIYFAKLEFLLCSRCWDGMTDRLDSLLPSQS